MLTLAINTASSTEALAIFDERRVRAEISWEGNKDESAKLLPNLLRVLKAARCNIQKIKRIIVVSGPGPFSALRIGVTTANVLAYMYGISLFEIDTAAFFWHRLENKSAPCGSHSPTLLLHAGGNYVYKSSKKGASEIHGISKIIGGGNIHFGDITDDQKQILKKSGGIFIPEKKLKSLGETMQKLPHSSLKKVSTVIPRYWRPPNITKKAV